MKNKHWIAFVLDDLQTFVNGNDFPDTLKALAKAQRIALKEVDEQDFRSDSRPEVMGRRDGKAWPTH